MWATLCDVVQDINSGCGLHFVVQVINSGCGLHCVVDINSGCGLHCVVWYRTLTVDVGYTVWCGTGH